MWVLLILLGLSFIYVAIPVKSKEKNFYGNFVVDQEDIKIISKEFIPKVRRCELNFTREGSVPKVMFEKDVLQMVGVWLTFSLKIKNFSKKIRINYDDGIREIFVDDELLSKVKNILTELFYTKQNIEPIVIGKISTEKCKNCIIFSTCEKAKNKSFENQLEESSFPRRANRLESGNL